MYCLLISCAHLLGIAIQHMKVYKYNSWSTPIASLGENRPCRYLLTSKIRKVCTEEVTPLKSLLFTFFSNVEIFKYDAQWASCFALVCSTRTRKICGRFYPQSVSSIFFDVAVLYSQLSFNNWKTMIISRSSINCNFVLFRKSYSQ